MSYDENSMFSSAVVMLEASYRLLTQFLLTHGFGLGK